MHSLTANRKELLNVFWRRVARIAQKTLAIFSVGNNSNLHLKQLNWSNIDRTKILELHNTHDGQTCVIAGTAPSLSDVDKNLINDNFVFALNKAFVFVQNIKSSADAIVITNPHAFNEYGEDAVAATEHYAFLSSALALDGGARKKIVSFSQYITPGLDDGFVQFDMTKPLYDSSSVAHAAIQIAIWMGFSKILLAGIDLDFNASKLHFYDSSKGEKHRGQTVSNLNRNKMLAGFEVIQNAITERDDVEILNLSRRRSYLPFKKYYK